MAMKEYSTFPRAPEQEPRHQMQFNVIPKTLRPSSTYDLMGWGFAIRAIGSGQSYVLGLDMTSRLIGGGLSDRPSSSSKGQGGVLQVMDCLATRIPSLSITGHHLRPICEPPLGGVLPLCRGAVSVFYCSSRQGNRRRRRRNQQLKRSRY